MMRESLVPVWEPFSDPHGLNGGTENSGRDHNTLPHSWAKAHVEVASRRGTNTQGLP